MDRIQTFIGQEIYEWSHSAPDRNTMVALAKLCSAMFGTNGMANGLACTQTTVPSMQVSIGQGEIYQMNSLEASVSGTLPQDTTNTILKQGILLGSAAPYNLPASSTFAAPGGAGQSINYLIEAQYQDQDVSLDPTTGASPVTLNFYNSANPATPWSGPGNSGASSNTFRKGVIAFQIKAGSAATTGSQITPSPDSGWLGLYVVTVANGQSTVLNANIATYAGAPMLPMPLTNGRLIGIRLITSTQVYVPTPGAVNAFAQVQAGGGAGGGAPSTATGNTAGGLGGTAGAYAEWYGSVSTIAGATVTIGAAGASVANSAGGNGGSTSLGSVVTCPGGPGGAVGQNLTPPWLLGMNGSSSAPTGTGLIMKQNGQGGGGSFSLSAGSPVSGAGGSSRFGSGGDSRGSVRSAGTAAVNYGSGGGGALEASAGPGGLGGGAGAPGVSIIWEYA